MSFISVMALYNYLQFSVLNFSSVSLLPNIFSRHRILDFSECFSQCVPHTFLLFLFICSKFYDFSHFLNFFYTTLLDNIIIIKFLSNCIFVYMWIILTLPRSNIHSPTLLYYWLCVPHGIIVCLMVIDYMVRKETISSSNRHVLSCRVSN